MPKIPDPIIRELPSEHAQVRMTDYTVNRVRRILSQLEDRSKESLSLYEPLPGGQSFHQSRAAQRIARGSNRAGKSAAAMADLLMYCLGRHPVRKRPKGMVKIYVVGKDERHLGETLYAKLCLQSPFDIIRDTTTGLWRVYKPWLDSARESERIPAPPILPQRLISDIGWYQKKLNVPKMIRILDCAELMFYSGNGKPPQGSEPHGALFDEEIPDSSWYTEIIARLVKHYGPTSYGFVWAATPQAGTQQLFDLHEMADAQSHLESPEVSEHLFHIKDNHYLSQQSRDAFKASLVDPMEFKIRWEGEFATDDFHIYPNFNMAVHGVEPFEIPKDWTRYMVVDPGHQVCAVLFAAVPPSDYEKGDDFVLLYDEIYARNCDANKFAELVAVKVSDHNFYEFVIDSHAGRISEVAAGLTTQHQYSDALRRQQVSSATTGHSFVWGMDDPKAGILAVHEWLAVRPTDGRPKLRVMRGRLPNFEHEMKRYRRKRVGNNVLDEPVKRNDHLVDCLRYLRGRNPQWHKPQPKERRVSPVYQAFLRMQQEERERHGAGYINLGVGQGTAFGDY